MAETEFQWTQDAWESSTESREHRLSSRNEKIAWFGVLALAVIAFELTADPAISVVPGCLKFGWDEFRLAGWLKRTDPDRRRGKICSRFYLAWGLWRVSLVASSTAFLLAFAYLTFGSLLGRNPGAGRPPPGFENAFLLALAGFLLSSVISSLAVFSALRRRIKVWVGPEARWAREANIWPPQRVERRKTTTNRAKPILLSALITGLMVLLMVTLLPLSFAFPRGLSSSWAIAIMVTLEMIFLIGASLLILVLLGVLGERMLAVSPEACWSSSS